MALGPRPTVSIKSRLPFEQATVGDLLELLVVELQPHSGSILELKGEQLLLEGELQSEEDPLQVCISVCPPHV